MFIVLFNSKDISHQYIHTNTLIHHAIYGGLCWRSYASWAAITQVALQAASSRFSLLLRDIFKSNIFFLRESQQSSRKQHSSPRLPCGLLSRSVCPGLFQFHACRHPGYQRNPPACPPWQGQLPSSETFLSQFTFTVFGLHVCLAMMGTLIC